MKQFLLPAFACIGASVLSGCALMSTREAVVPSDFVIAPVGEYARPAGCPEGLSGITWRGGDSYYAVNDHGGQLCPMTISVDRATGAITNLAVGAIVALKGGGDLEGVAFDAARGTIWASDEADASIREFPAVGGATLRAVPVPTAQKACRYNYSLESLALRDGGCEMWSCNEEALSADGDLASAATGSVVRLMKFMRSSPAADWAFAGSWAYWTDPFGGAAYRNYSRSGISDLLCLPDGTLLALERELSVKSLFPTFRCRIYRVDFGGATEVSGIKSLKGVTVTPVRKTLLFGQHTGFSMYEGACLGPVLDDGSRSLILISDGDDGAGKTVYALKLRKQERKIGQFSPLPNPR